MNSSSRFLLYFVLLAGLLSQPSDLLSQESPESAADFFPGTTAIYVELTRPADSIDRVINHSLTKSLQSMKAYNDFLASPEVAPGLVGLKMLENQTGEPIVETLRTHLSRGFAFGFDTNSEAPVVAFRTKDQSALKKLAGQLLAFAKNSGAKVQRKRYRNAKVAKVGQAHLARINDWFLISTKGQLLKEIIDRLQGDKKTVLSGQSWFNESYSQKESLHDIWATIDLNTLRSAGVAKELFAGKTDNAFAELLLGGVFDMLKNAKFANASLTFDKEIAFEATAPFQTNWTTEARQFFFGSADKPFQPKNLIASFSVYRDLGQWWLSKEELFDESIVAQLAQADSQFSTIFSGLDFGEEVLGNLKPEIQVVVAKNRYSDVNPDVKLPAFAFVSELKQGSQLKQRFKIAFQSAVGFANINLGMNGQPQLLTTSEAVAEMELSSAKYMVMDASDKQNILMNFGPTLAFNGSHFVLSSNREFAIELAQLAKSQDATPAVNRIQEKPNTRFLFNGDELKRILELNKESLITNNMLENGHSREKAEEETAVLLNIITLVDELSGDFKTGTEEMKFSLRLKPTN